MAMNINIPRNMKVINATDSTVTISYGIYTMEVERESSEFSIYSVTVTDDTQEVIFRDRGRNPYDYIKKLSAYPADGKEETEDGISINKLMEQMGRQLLGKDEVKSYRSGESTILNKYWRKPYVITYAYNLGRVACVLKTARMHIGLQGMVSYEGSAWISVTWTRTDFQSAIETIKRIKAAKPQFLDMSKKNRAEMTAKAI